MFNVDVNSTQGSTNVKIEVYNLLGEKIYTLPQDFIKSKQYQIDLSDKQAGVYLVNITTGFESRTERVVVNR